MTPKEEGPTAYPMPPADAAGGAHARPAGEAHGRPAGEAHGRPAGEAHGRPAGEAREGTPDHPPAAADDDIKDTAAKLLSAESAVDFRSRWEAIQHGFVDEPRGSMADADTLVGEVMERLAATFEAQRRSLESQWEHGEPSTEELREAFRRYRNFFERLLTV